jgi:hypothetical protein
MNVPPFLIGVRLLLAIAATTNPQRITNAVERDQPSRELRCLVHGSIFIKRLSLLKTRAIHCAKNRIGQ